MGLTKREIEILEKAKESNEWYFKALLDGVGIMAQRRAKYSGDGDPYTNFMITARVMGRTPDEVFPFYVAIKLGRMEVTTGDFSDESERDTLRDLANYSLLWLGWRIKVTEKSQLEKEIIE